MHNPTDVFSPFSPTTTTKLIDDINHIKFLNQNSLKILYLNARSIRNKIEDLLYIIATTKHQIHIISITEHWLSKEETKTFQIENYSTICSCRTDKEGGGSLILIRQNIPYEIIEQYSTNENSITSIKFKTQSKDNWIITSIYRRPNYSSAHINTFIDELNNHLNKIKNTNTIITGDMNINVLDSDDENTELYINTMIANDMYICDKTTITREVSQKSLDHVFTNNLTKKFILTYAPYDVLDHKLIFIEINDNIMSADSNTEQIITKKN